MVALATRRGQANIPGEQPSDSPTIFTSMTEIPLTDRRTALKKIGATMAGAFLLPGVGTAAGAAGSRPGSGNPTPGATARRPVLEIAATHDHSGNGEEHAFALSTDTVPAGWTTLVLDNQTDDVHFVYLSKVPQVAIDEAAAAGRPLLDYYFEQVAEPFQGYMDLLAGNPIRYPIEFPEWFLDGSVVPSGGVGLTGAHTSSAATVDLSPGEYVMECYVKDASNTFHGLGGMVALLTVTDDASEASPPRASATLSIGNTGFEFPDSIRPGRHAIAVQFDTQQVYRNLVGHDAHLLRLDGETSVDDLNDWMDWMDPAGLVSDGTEPTTFLGGVETVFPAGTTEYAHLTLTPGEYAWVAEVPDPASKGLLKPFTVPR